MSARDDLSDVELRDLVDELRKTGDVRTFMDAVMRPEDLPKVGTAVTTLRIGFGSSRPGKILTVMGHHKKESLTLNGRSHWHDDYISLRSAGGDEYLVEPARWWESIRVVLKEKEK